MENDCTQVEINLLVETEDGKILCCDAKLGFDDNAFFRQKDLFKLRDTTLQIKCSNFLCTLYLFQYVF